MTLYGFFSTLTSPIAKNRRTAAGINHHDSQGRMTIL